MQKINIIFNLQIITNKNLFNKRKGISELRYALFVHFIIAKKPTRCKINTFTIKFFHP